MFPPPRPWKQLAAVVPDREYVAFTSRFFLKSVRRLPAFYSSAKSIMAQVDAAPGIVGWSLGLQLFGLEFHTLSAWESAASLRSFVHEGGHQAALEAFEQDMRRKSIFVYYKVLGHDVPLTWKDAVARQRSHDKG